MSKVNKMEKFNDCTCGRMIIGENSKYIHPCLVGYDETIKLQHVDERCCVYRLKKYYPEPYHITLTTNDGLCIVEYEDNKGKFHKVAAFEDLAYENMQNISLLINHMNKIITVGE